MKKQVSAFTLMEIMVALFIFAIISVISAEVLHRAIKIKQHLQQAQTELNQKTDSIVIIKRAISHAVDYIDVNTQQSSMLGTQNKIEFNQVSQVLVDNQLLPVLLHAQIYYDNDEIIIQTSETKQTLFTKVDNFRLDYQDCNKKHFDNWQITPANDDEHDRHLPCVIDMSFNLGGQYIDIVAAIMGDDID